MLISVLFFLFSMKQQDFIQPKPKQRDRNIKQVMLIFIDRGAWPQECMGCSLKSIELFEQLFVIVTHTYRFLSRLKLVSVYFFSFSLFVHYHICPYVPFETFTIY